LPNFAFHENDNEAYKAHEETFQTTGRLRNVLYVSRYLKAFPHRKAFFIFNNFKNKKQQ
jgi:hypothetical protein